jgi:hypothetical protein
MTLGRRRYAVEKYSQLRYDARIYDEFAALERDGREVSFDAMSP